MIKKLEQLHEQICNECQDGLYYPPKEYQESSRRIFNAATVLYNESVSIYRDRSECGKKTKLSFNQLMKILGKIYEILQQAENWVTKESKVKDILTKNNIAPESLLKLEHWQGNFIEEVEK